MNTRFRVNLTLVLAVAARGVGQSNGAADRARIVFVCERGAAKSVIAAAYFNKLAAERGLREHATYRGASP